MGRFRALSPILAAALVGYVFEVNALAFGALLGVGAFVALLLARRPISVKFGALSLGGAVTFGFIAAVIAALWDIPVADMVAGGASAHFGGIVLGAISVMLAVLGLASLLWGALTGHSGDD